MRSSVVRNDPGFSPAAFGKAVFCNGARLTRVHTADEELGKAWGYAVNDEGRMIAGDDGHPIDVEYTGRIEIREDA